MMQWSAEMQMNFSENDDYGLRDQIDCFELIDQGSARRAKNIMVRGHEMDDFQECIFDFHYATGSGDDSVTHKTTAIFINSKSLMLPKFFMRPKNKLGKWFQRLRGKNQGPSDKEQLQYNYKIRLEDDQALDFLINSGIHNILLADSIFYLEGNGHYLIIYDNHKLLNMNQILNMRMTAHHIFDYLKANSWYV